MDQGELADVLRWLFSQLNEQQMKLKAMEWKVMRFRDAYRGNGASNSELTT